MSPDPVSSETESAALAEEILLVSCPPVVVATNLSAVKPEKVIVPEEEMPVNPEATPAVEISQEVELTATVFDPPPILIAPVEVPVLILVA